MSPQFLVIHGAPFSCRPMADRRLTFLRCCCIYTTVRFPERDTPQSWHATPVRALIAALCLLATPALADVAGAQTSTGPELGISDDWSTLVVASRQHWTEVVHRQPWSAVIQADEWLEKWSVRRQRPHCSPNDNASYRATLKRTPSSCAAGRPSSSSPHGQCQ